MKTEDSNIQGSETKYIKLGASIGKSSFTNLWDLKGQTEIVQIFISYGSSIRAIQFQYIDNGHLVTSPVFGDPNYGGLEFQAVKLNHPSEYITGISGYLIKRDLDSLTIHTNKGNYGPFGNRKCVEEESQKFSFQFGPDNQFGGFHGCYSSGLTGIGVYVKPLTTWVPITSSSTLSEKCSAKEGSHD